MQISMKIYTVFTAYPTELVGKEILPKNIQYFDLSEYITNSTFNSNKIIQVSILEYQRKDKTFHLELTDVENQKIFFDCKAIHVLNMLRFDWVDVECRQRNFSIRSIPNNDSNFVDLCLLIVVVVILIGVVNFLSWKQTSTDIPPSLQLPVTNHSNRN